MGKAEQMSFLFEEGGIADDGMDRDPVSGNEVPSGSMAEEVRDDIPAQLSEGEYVVPADVVRYYGVRFFEELRSEAKEGLGDMESEGRIGGEPMDDDMLSPEEEGAKTFILKDPALCLELISLKILLTALLLNPYLPDSSTCLKVKDMGV